MRVKSSCVVLCALLVAAPFAQGGVEQKTLYQGVDAPVAIAVDGAGHLHVSWQSFDKRLHYTRISGAKKHDEVVDPICGDYSSIALDSTGQPHIAYGCVYPDHSELKYAHFDGTTWHVEDVTAGGTGTIAIDAQDRPHIVHETGEFAASHPEYLQLVDGVWQIDAPPVSTLNGWHPTSLALDAAGHAHVGVVVAENGHPAYVTNASGDWVFTELADVPAGISLVLDSHDLPRVALPLVTGEVRYRHFDGSQWLSEDLYDPNELPAKTTIFPQDAALTLDALDRPAILFKGQLYVDGDTRDFVIYGFHDGVEWRGVPVTGRASPNWVRLASEPNGVSAGTYALRSRAHFDGQIAVRVRFPLPDLTGEWASLSVIPAKGSSGIVGTLEVRNQGTANSRAAGVTLYLSDDATLDPSDLLVGLRKIGAMKPGKTLKMKVALVHPPSVTSQYLIAVLDPGGVVDDRDRTNNDVAGSLASSEAAP